jgi:hypothetical protein
MQRLTKRKSVLKPADLEDLYLARRIADELDDLLPPEERNAAARQVAHVMRVLRQMKPER